jgi:hypothetical protein
MADSRQIEFDFSGFEPYDGNNAEPEPLKNRNFIREHFHISGVNLYPENNAPRQEASALNQPELSGILQHRRKTILPYTRINLINQKFSDELNLENISALEEYIPRLKIAYYTEKNTGKIKGLSVAQKEYDRIKAEYEKYLNTKNIQKIILETIHSRGIEITAKKGKYLFAAGPVNDGYFLLNQSLDYNAYSEIITEAEQAGLKPPYHVYGEFEVYQDKKNVIFYKIPETLREITERDKNNSVNPGKAAQSVTESRQFPAPLEAQTSFTPFGAWLDFNRRLSVPERVKFNNAAVGILSKPVEELTPSDFSTLRRYSGFGGTGDYDERGVLYDYYTSPPIARMTWSLLDKIKPVRRSDRILEPSCGTGVFFDTAPSGVVLHGVELDSRTAAVARLLHPSADIMNMSFEAFNISSSHAKEFDFVIGNVPFGDRSVNTMRLDMEDEKSLDRYFISRGIDALKNEGVMALIVHPGVLSNSSNETWRLSIARKARFLGAVKLNDHSFSHTHTRIQPDILFFTRYPSDIEQRLSAASDEQILHDGPDACFLSVGEYFSTHKNHVMGIPAHGKGQWGSDVVEGRVTPETIASMIESFEPERQFTEEDYEFLRSRFPLPENASYKTAKKK